MGCAAISSSLTAAAYKDDAGRNLSPNPSLQSPHPVACLALKQKHVTVYIKELTWIPENDQNLLKAQEERIETKIWAHASIARHRQESPATRDMNRMDKREVKDPHN